MHLGTAGGRLRHEVVRAGLSLRGVLVAAAVCPHPPLLVPEVAAGAAAEMDDVRAACDVAVRGLAAGSPDLVVVVGGAGGASGASGDAGKDAAAGTPGNGRAAGGSGNGRGAEFGAEAAGSLAGFGVGWATGEGEPVLPLSLTIGRWLLERNGLLPGPPRAPARGRGGPGARPVPGDGYHVLLRAVPFDAPAAACVALGGELARRAPRVAMLAMGDGSARRSTKAPGYFDPRAQRYDADVAAALASADPAQLARLDPALSAELMAAGRAAWQVLAGAAAGGQFRGQLHRVAAPYGVGYLVASWKPVQDGTGDPARRARVIKRL